MNEGLNPTSHEPQDSIDRVPSFFPYKDNRRLDLQVCRLRRLFMSHYNYMGLALADVQKGDLICILFGCSIPVALRRVEDYYIFIGAAYFHGWMEGDAVKLYQEGKLPLQDSKSIDLGRSSLFHLHEH
jgi:hypothetical protein